MEFQRVAVIGVPGAGKSTVSRELGEILGLTVTHLDALFWQPNWQETPLANWITRQRELVGRTRWLIDGSYNRTLAIRLERADLVVFLDFSTWRCLWRVGKRWWVYRGQIRPDVAAGCKERIDLEFLRFVWSYRRQKRPMLLEQLRKYSGHTVTLHNPRQVKAFLATLRQGDLARNELTRVEGMERYQ